MLSKSFFFNLFVMIHSHLVSSKAQENCSLHIINKADFVKEHLEFLDVNSHTLILQYDLDFSEIIPSFDIVNKSRFDAYQPNRWFRAKDRAVERLLLFHHTYFSQFVVVYLFKEIKVNLKDDPAGCLNNISSKDMGPFIRKFLMDDMGIKVETLRTSMKLSSNAEICSTYFADNMSDLIDYRCCSYDVNSEIECHNIYIDSVGRIASALIGLFIILGYMYSPMFMHKYDKSSSRTFKYSTGENNSNIESSMFCQYEGTGVNKTSGCSCKSCLSKWTRSKFYFAKLDAQIQLNLTAFMAENRLTFNGLTSFISFIFFDKSSSVKGSSYTRWTTLFFRILFFFVTNTLPYFLFFYFTDDFQPQLRKERLRRRGNSLEIIHHDWNEGWIYIFTAFHLILHFLLFSIPITIDVFGGDILSDLLMHLPKLMKENWLASFDFVKRHSTLCFFLIILFTPVSFFVIVFMTSPAVLIFKEVFSKSELREKGLFCCSTFVFFFYFVIYFFFHTYFLFQVFVVLMTSLMFQAAFYLPILSAIAALLVNLRIILQGFGAKHNKCLKSLVNFINHKKVSNSDVSNSFTLLNGSKHSLLVKKGFIYLKVEKSLAYITEGEQVKVNKSAVMHCMRHLYIKASIQLFTVVAFVVSVFAFVFVLGQFDYITTTNQVFITFVTGVIPSLVTVVKNLNNEKTPRTTNGKNQQEYKDFTAKLTSYSEEYLIEELKITRCDEQTVSGRQFIENLTNTCPNKKQTLYINIDDDDEHRPLLIR